MNDPFYDFQNENIERLQMFYIALYRESIKNQVEHVVKGHINPLYTGNPLSGILTNSEDPD